ncbi:PREDICTED: ankyrin repeat-containing protein At2g01680-like [Ipomoea nil]|uniref:ankyrin repeat-containing protein At2g01680-like n=1 Tax=Ipomoea nil TaxID=35883 RepID=UPI000901EE59|nr:PREDICTED: ankyrin repeat-containing protein At2g01680-like [Ipomoea nil]
MMKEMNMDRRVYEAAIKGDVRALRELIQEDELVLDRVTLNCFHETPLHIAVMRGHVEFARELLGRNPKLAAELDSRKSSPLHMASVGGDLEMVKLLLSADPEMCLASDRDGRNPLHLAAMKGRVEAVKELLGVQPAAVQQRTVSGRETVLHLCVKHNQIEALKTLMVTVERQIIDEIMNATDSDGNTILHLAVSDKQIEIIKHLLSISQIAVNSTNENGYTALDVLAQGLKKDTNDFEIGEMLRDAGALRAKEISTTHHHHQPRTTTTNNNHQTPAGDWLSRKRDSIMVVASLIATMAFQAGVNPPGGVWQENSESPQPHKAGEAVMAYNHAKAYRYFIKTNTTAFVASLSTILLLISGLPFRRRPFLWGLMVIMWLAVTTIALSYGIAIVIITPKQYRAQLSNVIQISVTVWCCVMSLLMFGNTVRLIFMWMKKKKKGKINVSWPQNKPSTATSVFTNV